MPTYEYACKSCDNQWEEVQKISEPSTKICPKCSKETAQRQISGGSFILKGGGWYADAYSSVKPESKSGSSDSGTKTETKSSEKKDAAPAAKEASKPSTPPASTSSSGSSGSSSSGSSSGSSSKD